MKQEATTLNCSFFLLLKLKTYLLFSIFIFLKLALLKRGLSLIYSNQF